MDGILPLFKPKGMTSHDCVYKIRKIYRTKKVGHTGTLDPDVTGVLPICIGKATKVVQYLTDAPKTYEGEVTLGFSTTTEDASGEVVDKKVVQEVISSAQIQHVFSDFTGEIVQTPPMYSAVKVNGKRLYEYARKGIEIERPSRNVTIYELKLLSDKLENKDGKLSFRFRVSCSKGTYVRTLAVDIGKALGYPAHMSDLTRTMSASFNLDQCYTLEQLQVMGENEASLNDTLLPIQTALKHFPSRIVGDVIESKVLNGGLLSQEDIQATKSDKRIVLFNKKNEVLAIYQHHPSKQGIMKPEKVIYSAQE